jgi:hypothetical protein
MKKLAAIFLLIICITTVACSGGGSSNPINVVTAPAITAISPQNGGPGTLVSIQGARFGLIQGNSIVSYAGVTVVPSSWSDTLITVLLPENAQNNGSFVVSVNGIPSNSSNPFTVSNPVIAYLTPQTAYPGAEVSIVGQFFGNQKADSYITFNSQTAQIVSWSSTLIRCIVPALAGNQSGNISVVVWLDASRYSPAAAFNLVVPEIASVHPASDNIGALVTITGQGFGQSLNQANGSVTFAGSAARVKSWSENSIQVRVPQIAAGGSQSVVTTIGVNANGRTATREFTVAAPVATSYSPANVQKNQLLTVFGSNFSNDSDLVTRSVSIDTTGAVNGVTYSDSSLSFTWPVENNVFGSQNRSVTVNIGGLTTTFSVTAE